ncbi:Uncharacterised protein [Cedecea lapagei]|uniref:Uncharacterized protein n=1 Tax=Cedecea lapagei TaxID=158823 RepID=A0A3S4KT18_9ENTR|nr:hypothetical protein [Cedecea lapagei]VEB96315.1 Uncharacterised protein [Cedecea lapagei]
MEKYVFYSRDIAFNIYPKASLGKEEKKQLAADGFKKIGFEIPATDEAAALDMFISHFKENTEALKEYTENIAFASILFVGIPFTA